jgi:two-component system, chemotaxis family, response regulator Rcp1
MNGNEASVRAMQVLLVEDSPGDVRLTREAFRSSNKAVYLHVARDGVEAMAFLKREDPYHDAPRPDFILLDLNLPKMDGREVLALIKDDIYLKTIPTVILTTSDADDDVSNSYRLHANCYLTKPVEFEQFERLVATINDFWLTKATLPPIHDGPGAEIPAEDVVAENLRGEPLSRATVPAHGPAGRAMQVLLIEDNAGDVRMTQKAFGRSAHPANVHVVTDGDEAMAFLRRVGIHVDTPRPDLILLDLNLPKLDGREILALIKGDDSLKTIPTVVLTTSNVDEDVCASYKLHANCYLTKPAQPERFATLVEGVSNFWLTAIRHPTNQDA